MSKRRQYQDRDDELNPATIPMAEVDAALFGAIRKAGFTLTTRDGVISIGGYRLTALGLQVDESATKGDWEQVGRILLELEGRIQLLIGDWLVEAG